MNRFKIRLIKISSVIILFVLVLFFIFRNQILVTAVNAKVDDFNSTHQAQIRFEKVCFTGFTGIHFDSILVTPVSDDTLLFISTLSARLNLWQLVAGHIRFRSLTISQSDLIVKQDSITSYYLAFSGKSAVNKTDSAGINFYDRSDRLLKRVFSIVPSRLIAQDISMKYIKDTLITEVYIGSLVLKNGKLLSVVKFTENNLTQNAVLEGKIKPGNRTVEISLKPEDETRMLRSPLASLLGAELFYKTLSLNFTEKRNKNNVLSIEGSFSLDRFEVDHPALSSKIIAFTGCSMKFDLSVGPKFIELDSISEIKIGKLSLNPYLKYSLNPSKTVNFSCYVPAFTVEEFFSSLPPDLFTNLKNIEAGGNISYRAKMVIDLNQPDSLLLESNLISENFKIKHLDDDLSKMRGSFIHTAYEKGSPARIIQVGPENPNFLPLEQIPVLLQNAILTAEDGAFYGHKGFLISAIRRAIAENIREHKFARGGSTISQQLIKNVYLSREKTISRKLEEVILVWIIESNRLVSKARMYEVYLNIIEWGPNVYGVKEAAQFYFQKSPAQLDASECIFLASVIPSPKKFYYRFNRQGKLAPFMIGYYNDMSAKLQRKGLLTSSNGDSLSAILHLVGTAKSYLRFDTIQADTTQIPEMLMQKLSE